MAKLMKPSALAPEDLSLLLERIHECYGYDFREYSASTISKRTSDYISRHELISIHNLVSRIEESEQAFSDYLNYVLIGLTHFFRSPPVFHALQKNVFPYLRSQPEIRIWHAGCSTGEEVYSMAILLKEADLYNRSFLYATDINSSALEKARSGIVSLISLKQATPNYFASGGKGNLIDHFHIRYGQAIIDNSLRKNILFGDHNLAMDGSFGEMHLVVCRNVLYYFMLPLRNRALSLLHESLAMNGFLCLGLRENIYQSEHLNRLQRIGSVPFLFRKVPALLRHASK